MLLIFKAQFILVCSELRFQIRGTSEITAELPGWGRVNADEVMLFSSTVEIMMFGFYVLAVELFSWLKKESIIEEWFSLSIGSGSKVIGLNSCFCIFVFGFDTSSKRPYLKSQDLPRRSCPVNMTICLIYSIDLPK